MDERTQHVIADADHAVFCLQRDGVDEQVGAILSAIEELRRLSALVAVDDQHAADPVEWPTHDGEWQMEFVFAGETHTRRVWFNAILPNTVRLNDVRLSPEQCAQWHARFLPIVLPTFPPREKPCEHNWGPWNHSDGGDGNPQSCRYCPKCEMHEFRTPDGETETLRL